MTDQRILTSGTIVGGRYRVRNFLRPEGCRKFTLQLISGFVEELR